MKKHIRLFLCAALVVCNTSVFAQWNIIASGVTDTLTATTYDRGRFFVAGDQGALLRSVDDGLSFSSSAGYTPGWAGGFNHLAFFDSLNGVATSTWTCCNLHRTANGGETWFPWQGSGMPSPWIEPVNDSSAVIYLGGPGLSFSVDGRLIQEEQFEVYANIDSICNQIYTPGSCELDITSNDTVFITGGWGWLRLSHDQGSTADTAIFNYGYYVYRSQIVSGDTIAYVDFDANLRLSNNKGLDWGMPRSIPGAFRSGTLIVGFDMLTAQHGVAVADSGLVQVTNNGGQNWDITAPLTNVAMHDVHFIDALQVYAVGDSGTILHSLDGGYSWQLEESGTSADLVAIASSLTTVIIVGANGVILRKDFSTSIRQPLVEPLRLSAFPNPTSNQLTILTPADWTYGSARLEVIDVLGRTLLSNAVGATGPYHLELGGLSDGHYLLRFSTWDGRNLQTAIIKRQGK